MDGSKAFAAARYVRIIKGAVEVEKGQAKAIEGLKKIDDFTLEMTLTERGDPGFYFYNGPTAIYPAGEADKETSCRSRSGSDRTSSSSTFRDRASSPSAGRSSTSPACRTRTAS